MTTNKTTTNPDPKNIQISLAGNQGSHEGKYYKEDEATKLKCGYLYSQNIRSDPETSFKINNNNSNNNKRMANRY